jgi:ribonuclease HII
VTRAPQREKAGPNLDGRLEQTYPGPVCGVDEAGRGPWAGPVSAAAVILDPGRIPPGLNDSKALTAAARSRLELEIRASALAFGIAFASVAEIAELNILQATGLAMRRAVDQLGLRPVTALIDGNRVFDLGCSGVAIVGGDGCSAAIAAASILAKTARDQRMIELDQLWPGYGLAEHKGYGVPAHAEALDRLGPCPEHRMSYRALQARLARRAVA